MMILEEVEGSKAIVALFDDNMVLVKPVYEYILWLKEQGMEPNTIVAYARDLKTYWEFLNFNGISYMELSPKILTEFVIYLRQPSIHKNITYIHQIKRKANTINRILGTVYSFYVHLEWLSSQLSPIVSATTGIGTPLSLFKGLLEHAKRENKTLKSFFKVKDREEDESDEENLDEFRILSHLEYIRILNAFEKQRDKLLFKFLYFSGVRISEALSLTIHNIPLPDNSNTGKYAVVKIKEPKKTGRRQQMKSGSRKVFVPTELLDELDEFITENRARIKMAHDFLFIVEQKQYLGKVLTEEAVRQKYKNIAQKLKIPNFTPHSLRHTCCTNLIAAGVNIFKVQKLMGHKHIATTQKYTHLSDQQLLSSLDKYWEDSVFAFSQVVLDDE